MQLEVEQKFPASNLPAVEQRIRQIVAAATKASPANVPPSETREEVDIYFSHPARDFRETDEAFRLRRIGTTNFITYKGPKFDPATKTRHELELPLPQGEGTTVQWRELLETLGFKPVATVHKRRTKYHIAWSGWNVEISLDEVDEVGTYLEIEIVTEADHLEAAKTALRSLAERLELGDQERRSYLSLLLAARGVNDGERV